MLVNGNWAGDQQCLSISSFSVLGSFWFSTFDRLKYSLMFSDMQRNHTHVITRHKLTHLPHPTTAFHTTVSNSLQRQRHQ